MNTPHEYLLGESQLIIGSLFSPVSVCQYRRYHYRAFHAKTYYHLKDKFDIHAFL